MKKMLTPQKSPEFGLLKQFSKKLLAILLLVLTSSIGFSQCTASFTAVDNGNGNYTFTSTSTGSISNATYTWSVSGTNPSYQNTSGASLNFTFANGTYTVSLYVSDTTVGCWSQANQTINVTSGTTCSISSGFSASVGGNGTATFTSTSTGNFDTELYYYGDGNSGTSSTHTYPSNGTYNVCLLAYNSTLGNTCHNTYCTTITITNIPNSCYVVANFSASVGSNGTVTFTSNSIGNINLENWYFGDGTTYTNTGSMTTTLNHTYTADGTYNVCLFVEDTTIQGCLDTLCIPVVISNTSNPCTPAASYTYVDNGSGIFSFTNTSTGATQYQWSFGDGNNSSATSPTHAFAANGFYNVVLTAYTSTNCISTYNTVIFVSNVPNNPPCNAGFSMYLDSLTNNIIVTNSSTGTNLSYFWDFGDGNTSTLAFPSYTYTTPGPFYLCLTVTDSANSCTSTYCDSIGSNGIVLKQTGFTINVQSPIATSIDEATKNIILNWSIYPNPFKENVTIEFVLKDNSAVEIFATDLIGNTVDVISNKMMHSGINNVKWNANKLSNGIYLVTIKTETSLQVKKVVLNR